MNLNLGGAAKLIQGPYDATKNYGLGTYGIDTTNGVVWALLNYNGYFAVVAGV